MSAPAKATITHEYHTPSHYITEPDKYLACSRYFMRRWMPLLGGVGTQIVLTLRSLGYYNYKDGETRNGIEIDIPELAALIGVCEATIKREFGEKRSPKGETGYGPQPLANSALHQFVKKERQYWRDPVTNRLLRTANIYRVMMDDPIHPDDLPRLQEILEAKEKGSIPNAPMEPKMPRGRKTPNAPMDSKSEPMDSLSSPLVDNANPMEPTLKDYSSLQENTSLTSATPGDSLALFQEPKEPEKPVNAAKRLLEASDSAFAKARRNAKKGGAV